MKLYSVDVTVRQTGCLSVLADSAAEATQKVERLNASACMLLEAGMDFVIWDGKAEVVVDCSLEEDDKDKARPAGGAQ